MTAKALIDAFSSGTFTPTLTNNLNTSSLSAQVASYMRVGDVVTVSGVLSVTKGTSATATFTSTVPIAANVTMSQGMAGGVGTDTGTNTAQPSWCISGMGSGSLVRFNCIHTYTSGVDLAYTYTYRLNA